MDDQKFDHPMIARLAEEMETQTIDRRVFLRFATLLGMSAATAYGLAGLTPAHAAGEPKSGGTLRILANLDDISDPHAYSWGQENFMRQALETLTVTGIDNVTRPLLLDRWEASDDVKTWTLFLRKDVKWSDGRVFNADDVIWNLKHALDPESGSSFVSLFADFVLEQYDTDKKGDDGKPVVGHRLWREDAIERVDDYTVRLNGKIANVLVPEQLYHEQLFIIDPKDNGKFAVGSASTGPYSVVEFQKGQRCLMKAREDYWGEGPYISELEVLDLGADPNAQLAAIASKQIDGLMWADNAALDTLRKLDHVQVYEAPSANTGAVRMRVGEKPFDDPRVRKAMRLAIDPEAVLQLGLGGLGYLGTHTLISEFHPDHGDITPMKRDVEMAKKLLAEAGYPDGIDAELYLKSAPSWESAIVQSMLPQWAEANIRIKMQPVPPSQYWDIWKKVPLGFTDWNHRPLGIMLYGLVLKSGGEWNESGYSNPEFDALLTKAGATLDMDERRKIMAQMQEMLLEDGPLVQPVYRNVFTAYNKKLKNFQMHPSNSNYYKDMWIEEA